MAIPRAAYMPDIEPVKPREFTQETLIDDLAAIGVPPRARKADRETVPKCVQDLHDWQDFPARPFGLVGEGGVGKSCALVFALKRALEREVAQRPRLPIFQNEPVEYRWVGWPALAGRMNMAASRRDWDDVDVSTVPLIEWICGDPKHRILILDDIGEEGKFGGHVTTQLDLLIDAIYNYEARMFWTSMKSVTTMAGPKVYGYRMMSRLTGASPDFTLPAGLPDLRIQSR